MKVYNNILDTIGNTPLVKLNSITQGLKPSIYAKVEFFNPGGSVKDRIGIAMIEDAEAQGLISPGGILVEPTSGNTGTGLALAAIAKGYQVIFTIPDKMSKDKIDLLRAFGARVIITPTSVEPDHPSSYVKVAERIVRDTPNALMLSQYFNPANPMAHYKTTGPEIFTQTNGKINVLVAGMGTGGTITGAGKYLKENVPGIKLVGVDPEGSIFHHEFFENDGEIHSYKVEGIGEDFMPSTIDLDIIDDIITVSDKDAFLMTRRLAHEEGIFAGGSSGAAVFGALQIAKNMTKSEVIVVILPDTGRNYLDKIYSDDWMSENRFIEHSGKRIPIIDILKVKTARIEQVLSVNPEDTLDQSINLMHKFGISQLPVISDGVMIGSLRELTVMKLMSSAKVSASSQVETIMDEPFFSVNLSDEILDPFILLRDKKAFVVLDEKKIIDIITTADVVSYLVSVKK